ncbi:MAG TPA: ABC transporter ATP-binding protein, partial [Marmoricola sp.]|nr:ABC transporter ATP-binding protein [Marmoricola sp.]
MSDQSTQVTSGEELAAFTTIRRGMRISPEFSQGLLLTIGLALLGTAGRVVVPIAVQQTLDRGINAPGGVDVSLVARLVGLAAGAVILTGLCSFLMTTRLFTASERGLATLRIKAFRHIHDL